MAEQATYHFDRYGFELDVYRNRVEVRQRKILGWQTDTLLMREITNVSARLAKLTITLSDGGKREYTLNGAQVEEARRAILAQL